MNVMCDVILSAGTSSSRPAAFFDRDGVINIDHGYVHSPDQFDLVAGAGEGLRLCREMGFLIFIVTNQAGVAYGYYDEAAIDALHKHMRTLLARSGAVIDDIRYCPHHPQAVVSSYACACDWRKPRPGMILDLARQWSVDLTRSFLVGDKMSDLEAASAAGVKGHLFSGGNLVEFLKPIFKDIHQSNSFRAGCHDID
jgi:D-glycero-D-manno-heptose 1,7-bisphosphate phosphatase